MPQKDFQKIKRKMVFDPLTKAKVKKILNNNTNKINYLNTHVASSSAMVPSTRFFSDIIFMFFSSSESILSSKSWMYSSNSAFLVASLTRCYDCKICVRRDESKNAEHLSAAKQDAFQTKPTVKIIISSKIII